MKPKQKPNTILLSQEDYQMIKEFCYGPEPKRKRKRKSIEFRTLKRHCTYFEHGQKDARYCANCYSKILLCKAANCPIWRRLPDV